MNIFKNKPRSESISSLSIDSKSESYDSLYELEKKEDLNIDKEPSKILRDNFFQQHTKDIKIKKEIFIKKRHRETQIRLSQSPQIEDVLNKIKIFEEKRNTLNE